MIRGEFNNTQKIQYCCITSCVFIFSSGDLVITTSGFRLDKRGSGNFGFRLGNVDSKMKPFYSKQPNYSLDKNGMTPSTRKRSIRALEDQSDDYLDPLEEGSLNSDLQRVRYGNKLTRTLQKYVLIIFLIENKRQ